MDKYIIAIDGVACSGKGTLSRSLSQDLGFKYLDTGKMYRALAFLCIQSQFTNELPEKEILKQMVTDQISLELLSDSRLLLEHIGLYASRIAQIPYVRELLCRYQLDFIEKYRHVILDGRDIGTVIVPDAQVKFFLTASAEVRAKRRYQELLQLGHDVRYDNILNDLIMRDDNDVNRPLCGLKPADDAIMIDTSDMNATEVLDFALSHIQYDRQNLV